VYRQVQWHLTSCMTLVLAYKVSRATDAASAKMTVV
jgi:hypothetical protein